MDNYLICCKIVTEFHTEIKEFLSNVKVAFVQFKSENHRYRSQSLHFFLLEIFHWFYYSICLLHSSLAQIPEQEPIIIEVKTKLKLQIFQCLHFIKGMSLNSLLCRSVTDWLIKTSRRFKNHQIMLNQSIFHPYLVVLVWSYIMMLAL